MRDVELKVNTVDVHCRKLGVGRHITRQINDVSCLTTLLPLLQTDRIVLTDLYHPYVHSFYLKRNE
jgi:hypothetical protein